MTSHPPDDDSFESAPVSADAITPRGGFMARPGLKSPPRHAVVVRGGDAPESEHIPVLRSSFPPPPPVSEPVPSASEKITLRAIPTPTPPAPAVAAEPPTFAPPALESLPPPSIAPSSRAPLSDAPFVTSSLEPSTAPRTARPMGSRWTIVAAAAAGLLLGLVSVAVKLGRPSAAEQPPPADTLAAVAVAPHPAPTLPELADSAAARQHAAPSAPSSQRSEPRPARPPAPSTKRSIF
jgi:hypothetical protein